MQNPTFVKIKNYVQSKRIHIAVVAGVLIIGTSVYGISKKDSLFITHVDNSKKLITLQGVIELDSDSDGLLDWEESLWGTDPKNADTNGDGVSDGDEIGARKSELGLNIDENAELNETERFSREFFATIVSLSQQGLLNEKSLANLSNTISDQIVVGDYPDAYTSGELTINPSFDATIAYTDDLATLFKKMERTTNIGIELLMTSELLSNKTARQNDLFKLSQKYKEFAKDAIEISVPKKMENMHLQLVNNLYNLGVSIERLSEVIDNPLVGLQGIAGYTKYSAEFVTITTKIRDSII